MHQVACEATEAHLMLLLLRWTIHRRSVLYEVGCEYIYKSSKGEIRASKRLVIAAFLKGEDAFVAEFWKGGFLPGGDDGDGGDGGDDGDGDDGGDIERLISAAKRADHFSVGSEDTSLLDGLEPLLTHAHKRSPEDLRGVEATARCIRSIAEREAEANASVAEIAQLLMICRLLALVSPCQCPASALTAS
eukprot:scaffold2245_cov232-Pinguiococcus_pyrenoidosus.AAC.8